MISWFLGLPWMRHIRFWTAELAGILVTIRKSGERAGLLEERFDQEQKTTDAKTKILQASHDRPADRDDLARRVRDGSF